MKYTVLIVFLIQTIVFGGEYCEAYNAYKNNEFSLAKDKLNSLVFKGDAASQNLLGLINLEQGNYSAAKKWLQNAAGKQYAKAAYNLGVFHYAQGNNSKAESWVQKAENLTEGKLALGFLYTDKDMTKAKTYFALAAKEGNAFAKSHLCAILAVNQKPSDNKYVNICQGNVIEDLYTTGKFYTAPKKYGSYEKAIFYLKKAADQGHVKAMNLLGEQYYKRRMNKDESLALEYFVKASALGNVDAKVNAAWIYYVGVKWSRKPKKGLAELTEAVKLNNAKAKYYMGRLYTRAQTIGPDKIQRNPQKGLAYIKEAADQNDADAMQYMIQKGTSIQEQNLYQKHLNKYYRDREKERALHFLHDGC